MIALPLLLLTAAPTPPADQPRTYVVSVVGFPLKPDESVESFSFETWGVAFRAVCRVPPGWRIKAGGSATSDGVLEGEGSHGATWFRQSSPEALSKFALVTLYAPLQARDIVISDGKIPATFKGYATISTNDGEVKVRLTSANIRLTPADHC